MMVAYSYSAVQANAECVLSMQLKTIPRNSQRRFFTLIRIKTPPAHFGRHLLRLKLESPGALQWPRTIVRKNHLT
ncbi:hypothetical protein EMIT0232MI5_30094 [Pseudomonas sp. IT-232MI5]